MHCEIRSAIGTLGSLAITNAGKHFKFKYPLTGEYKIGRSWKEPHKWRHLAFTCWVFSFWWD